MPPNKFQISNILMHSQNHRDIAKSLPNDFQVTIGWFPNWPPRGFRITFKWQNNTLRYRRTSIQLWKNIMKDNIIIYIYKQYWNANLYPKLVNELKILSVWIICLNLCTLLFIRKLMLLKIVFQSLLILRGEANCSSFLAAIMVGYRMTFKFC